MPCPSRGSAVVLRQMVISAKVSPCLPGPAGDPTGPYQAIPDPDPGALLIPPSNFRHIEQSDH